MTFLDRSKDIFAKQPDNFGNEHIVRSVIYNDKTQEIIVQYISWNVCYTTVITEEFFRKVLKGQDSHFLDKSAWFEVCIALVANPKISADMLEHLASTYQCSDFLTYVAMHPNVTPKILDILSYSSHSEVLEAIAVSSNASEESLLRISKSGTIWVRAKLIYNPNCPVGVVEILAQDPVPMIKRCAIKHPLCPVAYKFMYQMEE